MNDKSKLELISEIAQASNKNLELIQEINNLQSKIDKAIEYIEKEKYVSADENCEIIAGYHIYELLDILKEDK